MQFSPESGCNLACDKRLFCGHSCTGRCHSDTLHHAVKCLATCPRLKKGYKHACPLRCGDTYHSKCLTILEHTDLLLPCGHRLPSPRCWEAQNPASVRCVEMVTKKVPGCASNVTKISLLSSINALLPAGIIALVDIPATLAASTATHTEQKHGICNQRCGRNYSTCQHSCS